ncbi:(deoxy)nucleoside triphosphate pyrophosphohydrolase [Minwuia thermotolerans]|uniref:8-oxo-dGTP diphosphatase n=1 Tax=Minwuia thermotolerans TaxID=2056226 RepID=A0A2M9G2G3_9PROT|nr:(deoxy)nucleoside triphosphate pyrophosphohydrolase [Minwuia thermotolerans]PJK29909.1 8-oxo-dGTP diphosphatase MutT [Minwuia thermotolerans]
MTLVLVAAVALINEQREVLLAERPEGKSMAGLWEFPGGKVEPDESPEDCLVRECGEELGIRIDPADLRPLTFASHAYDDFHLLMPVFACRRWAGTPAGLEEQRIAFVAADDLASFPMPPADAPMLGAIRAEMAR